MTAWWARMWRSDGVVFGEDWRVCGRSRGGRESQYAAVFVARPVPSVVHTVYRDDDVVLCTDDGGEALHATRSAVASAHGRLWCLWHCGGSPSEHGNYVDVVTYDDDEAVRWVALGVLPQAAD